MKRLNNKGITTIEVIICFVLVVMITVSMYSTVSYFNDKRTIEGYKEQVYSYKDLLTKEIQDDFIKIGLTHAEYKKTEDGNKTIYTVDCILKDGTKRRLVVEQIIARSPNHQIGINNVSNYSMIRYGVPEEPGKPGTGDMINYPLPDLGSTRYKKNSNPNSTFELCEPEEEDKNCNIIQDLAINNIKIEIVAERILSIHIGFDHPELQTRYGINIVVPIDYVTDGGAEDSGWF